MQAIKDHPIKFIADPTSPNVFAGETQITHAIRGTSVTENVSRISAMPEIRRELLNLQHRMIDAAERGIVVEGRDIGTVVAPEAGLKIKGMPQLSLKNQWAKSCVSTTAL